MLATNPWAGAINCPAAKGLICCWTASIILPSPGIGAPCLKFITPAVDAVAVPFNAYILFSAVELDLFLCFEVIPDPYFTPVAIISSFYFEVDLLSFFLLFKWRSSLTVSLPLSIRRPIVSFLILSPLCFSFTIEPLWPETFDCCFLD